MAIAPHIWTPANAAIYPYEDYSNCKKNGHVKLQKWFSMVVDVTLGIRNYTMLSILVAAACCTLRRYVQPRTSIVDAIDDSLNYVY